MRLGAYKESGSQGIFEHTDSCAYSRLTDVQSLGGTMETAVGRHGEEGFYLIDFHKLCSFSQLRRVLVFSG